MSKLTDEQIRLCIEKVFDITASNLYKPEIKNQIISEYLKSLKKPTDYAQVRLIGNRLYADCGSLTWDDMQSLVSLGRANNISVTLHVHFEGPACLVFQVLDKPDKSEYICKTCGKSINADGTHECPGLFGETTLSKLKQYIKNLQIPKIFKGCDVVIDAILEEIESLERSNNE